MKTNFRQRGMVMAGALAMTAAMVLAGSAILVLNASSAKSSRLVFQQQTERRMSTTAEKLNMLATEGVDGAILMPAPVSGGTPDGDVDGWGRPFQYCSWPPAQKESVILALVSAGADGRFQTDCAAAVTGQLGDDLVLRRSMFAAQQLLGGRKHFQAPVATVADLDTVTPSAVGESRIVLETGEMMTNLTGQTGAGQWVSSITPDVAGNGLPYGTWTTQPNYLWGTNAYQSGADPVIHPLKMKVASVSSNFLCALYDVVQCYGDNTYGQLGNGGLLSSETPTKVLGDHDFSTISTGEAHVCAVTQDEKAYCWGKNDDGQLGDGALASQSSPVQIQSDQNYISVAAGRAHTCALSVTGAIVCWGDNQYGQLGESTTADHLVPVHSTVHRTFTTLSSGSDHSCAISMNGVIYCWGRNHKGQLGDGTLIDRSEPVPVSDVGVKFKSISAGGNATCAISDVSIYCWGDNQYGQLGTGDLVDRSIPSEIQGGLIAYSVATSGEHTCMTTEFYAVYCWGSGLGGRAPSSSIPVIIAGIRAEKVSVAGQQSLAYTPFQSFTTR